MTEKKKIKIGKKTVTVPDDNGKTPKKYLEEVNSKRSARSISQDRIHKASTTYPTPTKTEDAARWIAHPGRYDIEGIDSPPKEKASKPKKAVAKKPVAKKKAEPKPKKPTVKKTAAKPKAKPTQDDPDIKLMARYFRAIGKEVSTPEEFVMASSLEFKWMSPNEAKAALKRLTDKGLIEQKGDFIRSTIYLDDVDVSEPQNLAALKEATKKNDFLKDHIVFASVPAPKPKKPVKDTDMKRFANMILSFYNGSITKDTFVKTISDLYKWVEPDMAAKLFDDLIKDGYLEYRGNVCVPTFDLTPVSTKRPRRSTVPWGYRRDPHPNEKLGKNAEIRAWYMYEFPTDFSGEDIRRGKTFYDLFEAMDKYVDVYDFLNIDDSVVRERVFEGLADVMGVPYNEVYEKWMMSNQPRDPEINAAMDYERWWDDQLGSNNRKSFKSAMTTLQKDYLRESGDRRPIAKDPEVCGFLADLYGYFYEVYRGNAPTMDEVGYGGFLEYITDKGVNADVRGMLAEDGESDPRAQALLKRLDAIESKYASKPRGLFR